MIRFATAGITLLLVSGCGPSTGPADPGVPVSLVVTSGAAQQAEVATELPEAVVVRVADADGGPVPNQIVNFVVASGYGSVFAGTTLTNAQGEARERWTLGTVAGEQALEARAVDPSTGEPLVFGRITATALPGAVAEILVRPGLSPIFLGRQLEVAPLILARDRYVNIVTDPPLTIGATSPFQAEGTRLSSTAEIAGSITLTSGAASISRFVTALRDLTELVGATGTWACTGTAPYFAGEPEGTLIMTHQSTAFTVDSVRYFIEPSGFASPGIAHPQMFITGTTTSTIEDGSTRTDPEPYGLLQAVQSPGRLDWEFPEGPLVGTATPNRESPLSYAGGNGCSGWNLTGSDDFMVTK